MQRASQTSNNWPPGWLAPASRLAGAGKLSLAARGFLGLVLAACLVQAVRQAVASWFARRNSPDSIRRAEMWDPSNPDYAAQLGRALAARGEDADPNEVAAAFERAVQ